MRRACCIWLGLLAGCSGTGTATGRIGGDAYAVPRADASSVERIHLELIERLLRSERAYAALAHLDALSPADAERPEARWLRAESLRRIGDLDAARRLYTELSFGAFAGLAERGLGLIDVGQGELSNAVVRFERARTMLPTDVRVRNDLGYAYLLQERYDTAEAELRTAIELDPKSALAINNVLLLLQMRAIAGDDEAYRMAAAWAERYDLEVQTVDRVHSRASALVHRSSSASPKDRDDAAGIHSGPEMPVGADEMACDSALAGDEGFLEPSRWLMTQRNGVCRGSAPRMPSRAGARIYHEYLKTFGEAAGGRRVDPQAER